MKPEIMRVGETSDLVGESPLWDHRTNCLYWVDIVGRRLRRFDLATSAVTSWSVDDFPTALALAPAPDQLILTMGLHLGTFDLRTGAFSPLASFEDGDKAMRLNEGKCDPAGRFWLASMDNNLHADGSPRAQGAPRGRLFSFDGENVRGPWVAGLGIPNTMVWSPDATVFYFADTPLNVIWAFDYDLAGGTIRNRRVFVEGGPGLPDGSTIDAEGHIWTARFGAGCIIRYTPDGRSAQVVELTATNPTACVFGSPEFDRLYVTSARFNLPAPAASDGALLALDVGQRGFQSPIFGVGA